MPIIKKRGINEPSKKIKKINKSKDENNPIRKHSMIKKDTIKYPVCSLILFQLVIMQIGISKVVKRINDNEIPSMPR